VHEASTDDDGRVMALAPEGLAPGVYRLVFDTGSYFAGGGRTGFYPEVSITFTVDEERHYHVPLLLSPFAFSTYRGS
jgi:5-hydroxyisourate hydrolase